MKNTCSSMVVGGGALSANLDRYHLARAGCSDVFAAGTRRMTIGFDMASAGLCWPLLHMFFCDHRIIHKIFAISYKFAGAETA